MDPEPDLDPTVVRPAPRPTGADPAASHAPAGAPGQAGPRRAAEGLPPRRWPRRVLFAGAATVGVGLGAGALAWRQGLLGGAAPAGPAGPPSLAASGTPTGAAGLRAETGRGLVTVDAVAAGIVRVRILDGADDQPPHSYAIEDEAPSVPATLTSSGGRQVLSTPELTVSLDPTTGAIAAATPDGVSFIEEPAGGYRRVGKGFVWKSTLAASESCHGLGERSFPLSLRDGRYRLWNHDAGSYQPGSDPLYLNVPFYLGHRPDVSYGIFWDNPARGAIGLDVDGDGVLTFSNERRPVTMYVIVGPRPAQVVQRFTGLVGRMDLPPLWAAGYHQSRWSYRDAAAYRAIARRMRAEKIPCDALHFDIDYMDGFRIFTWNTTLFPAPRELLSELSAEGFRSVAIVDPGVKVDPAYPMYADGQRLGVFLKQPSGAQLARTVWAGPSEFPDFTSPDCRAWWAGHAQEFVKAGFAGLWNDMNEPSTFDAAKTLPDDTPHSWEGEGNTHVGGGHNVYGMQMARASRDGLVTAFPDRRPFVISRDGYAGLQRYASSWNGDSRSTWESLRLTVPQLLNLGMSGIAFTGSDAGGFRGTPSAELYLRWMQLASMTPFFRTHSARTAPERNPWTYGEPTTGRIREVVNRRYRLLPYLYTAFQQASVDGTPLMRPLFFEDPANADYPHVDDQFLLGDHLLVAPILSAGARTRPVVLPAGGWYRFDSGVPVRGGRTVQDAAGYGLPLYVRAGAVLPTWPVVQHTGDKVDTLVLDVYAGAAVSHLYEDAGEGYAFRDGSQRTSTFTTRGGGARLSVAWKRKGTFEPGYSAVEVRLFGLTGASPRVTVDGKAVTAVSQGGVRIVRTHAFSALEVR